MEIRNRGVLPKKPISKLAKHLAELACVGILLLIPARALGQAGQSGTLTGRVRGPGGVSVPGATVVVTESTTGERKATWTDEAGNFRLENIAPGTYKLEVSLVGFRKDVREPVPVTAGKSLAVNIALVIDGGLFAGATSTSGATRRAGALAGGENLQASGDLMSAGSRNMSGEGNPSESPNGSPDGSVRFLQGASAGGMPASDSGMAEENASASGANSFLLSGGTGVTASTPGEDGRRMRERFQQFREQMGGQGAPGFGGGASGPGGGGGMEGRPSLEMMATFGGGRGGPGGWAGRRAQVNRIRGNISEQYSNSALDAHPYPLNAANSPRIPAYSEQVGIGFGGPLVIPKVYNGAEKTSFFVNYSLTRSRNEIGRAHV